MPFQPGQSGNPSGRAKKSNPASMAAREYLPECIAVLVGHLKSGKEEVAQKAAIALMDRGFGKPQEYHEFSGDEENPLQGHFIVTFVRQNANT